jgi:hypothetical protein
MAGDPESFCDHNVNVARQAQTKRNTCCDDEGAADPIHVFRVLAGIDNPVIRSGCHQHHDGERDQKEARGMHHHRCSRELLEGLCEHNGKLEAEQGLCARQYDARLVSNCSILAGNGVLARSMRRSLVIMRSL